MAKKTQAQIREEVRKQFIETELPKALMDKAIMFDVGTWGIIVSHPEAGDVVVSMKLTVKNWEDTESRPAFNLGDAADGFEEEQENKRKEKERKEKEKQEKAEKRALEKAKKSLKK